MASQKGTSQGYAVMLIVLAAIFGSSVSVASKFALDVFKPFTLISIRFFFAILVLLPLIVRKNELSIANFKKLLPVAAIGSLNPILLFIALQFTQASFAPLIYASVPAMTALYIYFIDRKKILMKQILGIVLGFSGVGFIVVLPLLEGEAGNLSFIGNGLIFLAAIAFLMYGVTSKKLQGKDNISPLSLTFYFSLVTLLVSLPFVFHEFLTYGPPENIELAHLASGIYIGIGGTGVFYLLYQYALKVSSAVTASLFTYIQPISGILLANLLLGEIITIPFALGGILAVVGAGLASSKK